MRLDEIVARLVEKAAEKPAVDGRSKAARKNFYASPGWRKSQGRYKALKAAGGRCQACGASGRDVRLCVDHIKPVRHFWELRFDPENMQVLCDDCNLAKGSWDSTDWR